MAETRLQAATPGAVLPESPVEIVAEGGLESLPPAASSSMDNVHVTLGDLAVEGACFQRNVISSADVEAAPLHAADVVEPATSEEVATSALSTDMNHAQLLVGSRKAAARLSRLSSDEIISTSDAPLRPRSARGWRATCGHDVERGRTLQRGSGLGNSNPLAKAESSRRKHHVSIELDARPILRRPRRSSTLHDDPASESALLDDVVLEPFPNMALCSAVGEVLAPRTRTGSVKRVVFERSRTDTELSLGYGASSSNEKTVFSACRPLYPAPTLPPDKLASLCPDIGYLEYMATKSSVHVWSRCSTTGTSSPLENPNIHSGAAGLPIETLQQIYTYLTPRDYNAARHACRSWFFSSLDAALLKTMLRRGGWSEGAEYDLAANRTHDSPIHNTEWLMSKRLARECALGASWSGHGLNDSKGSAFVSVADVDFTELSLQFKDKDHPSGCLFTVSNCSRFLIVSHGCMVYLYELNRSFDASNGAFQPLPGALRPVTSIICPHRVIACSMDTNSHRYAVAILLDGRMGMVCEIPLDRFVPRIQTPDADLETPILSKAMEKSKCNVTCLKDVSLQTSRSHQSFANLGDPPMLLTGTPASNLDVQEDLSWREVLMRHTFPMAAQSSQSSTSSRRHSITPSGRLRSVVPSMASFCTDSNVMILEDCPRSMYRDLCSSDDPPRSVAICPQRRCVAFGCSAGIELHWVDALTGQELNRWFPLNAPSDFLFFLPPRKTVDSAKKLRLISSTARLGERAAAVERAFGTRDRNSPFWHGHTSQESAGDNDSIITMMFHLQTHLYQANFHRDSSDHYRAIPLSDGYHILFTDPSTSMLCLGSDAPIGGPTKLLRKIWFHGPHARARPVVYTAGADLKWGVRVAAAYSDGDEQKIYLFSVPVDVFASSTSAFPLPHTRHAASTDWVDWWPDDDWLDWTDSTQEEASGFNIPRHRPVRIHGQEIGRVAGIVDIAIDSGPIMTIWALSKNGRAHAWTMGDASDVPLRTTHIARDGSLKHVHQGCERDNRTGTSTPDTASCSSPKIIRTIGAQCAPGGYDGSNHSLESMTTPARHFARRERESTGSRDVGLEGQDDHEVKEGDDGHQGQEPVSWARYGWSEASFRGQIATVSESIVEDDDGIARIELEIR